MFLRSKVLLMRTRSKKTATSQDGSLVKKPLEHKSTLTPIKSLNSSKLSAQLKKNSLHMMEPYYDFLMDFINFFFLILFFFVFVTFKYKEN